VTSDFCEGRGSGGGGGAAQVFSTVEGTRGVRDPIKSRENDPWATVFKGIACAKGAATKDLFRPRKKIQFQKKKKGEG